MMEDEFDEEIDSGEVEFESSDHNSDEHIEEELLAEEEILHEEKSKPTSDQTEEAASVNFESNASEIEHIEEDHNFSSIADTDHHDEEDHAGEHDHTPEFSAQDELLIAQEGISLQDLDEPEMENVSINALQNISEETNLPTDMVSVSDSFSIAEEMDPPPPFNSELDEQSVESMVIPQMGLAQTAKISADAAALEVQPPDESGGIIQRTDGELKQGAAHLSGYQPTTEQLPSSPDGLGATPQPSQALNRIRDLSGDFKSTRYGFG
jgi:hypothetical protein